MAKKDEQANFDFEDDLEVSKNSLTILITGILVIVAGFVTYNFFADQAAQPAGDELANDVIQQLEEEATTAEDSAALADTSVETTEDTTESNEEEVDTADTATDEATETEEDEDRSFFGLFRNDEQEADADEDHEQVAADQATDAVASETEEDMTAEEDATEESESEGGVAGSSTERDRSFFGNLFRSDKDDEAGDDMPEGTGGPEEGVEVVEETITTTTYWTANDIAPNTLTGTSTYTVQEGDTLWEIAEGVYGSGFEWVKIVDANADSIDYLANGSQALISAGQVLNLPN